jgi:very-short-patch-repair endonuclease
MLSFRHPKASCLRVIDELPGQLFASLLDGDILIFEPVPEPTQRELEIYRAPPAHQVPRGNEPPPQKNPDAASWARRLAFNVDYDLPVETDIFERPPRHSDRKIQTLHYPDDLDARLRKIRAAGRTAIEESGANMLYFAFGFLEWRDQQTSKPHQAPLVLLPVELTREPTRAGRYRTSVRWTGEELQPNLSLKKKLKELNIVLPELENFQELESYLTEVARAIQDKPDWLIRRYVTLALFEFGKILLYLDLDPAKWQDTSPLAENKLVRQILVGGDQDGGGQISEPDLSPTAVLNRDLNLEVVDRADSSQCEALDVALSGRSLVVQGPPGTGKSQTITNLVAAALSRGKTILFVAEKLAALEMVRRRMRELGLGDFCLELHSHKTRKLEVLEDIVERMRVTASVRSPAEYETAMSRLKAKRAVLSEYVETIAAPAGSLSSFSVSDALMQAGRARRRLGADVKVVERAGSIARIKEVTWADLADAKSRLRQFVAAVVELGQQGAVEQHPWAGVSSIQVLPHDQDRLAELAGNWAAAAEQVAELAEGEWSTVAAEDMAQASEAFVKLDSLRIAAAESERAAKSIETLLGLDVSRSAEQAKVISCIIEVTAATPFSSHAMRTDFSVKHGAAAWLEVHAERLRKLLEKRQSLADVFREIAFNAHPDDLEHWAVAFQQRNPLMRLGGQWRAAARGWREICRPAATRTSALQKMQQLTNLRSFILEMAALRSDPEVLTFLGESGQQLAFDTTPLIALTKWADIVRARLPESHVQQILVAPASALQEIGAISVGTSLGQMMAITDLDKVGGSFWAYLVECIAPRALHQMALRAEMDDVWAALILDAEARNVVAVQMLEAERRFREATALRDELWFGFITRPTFSAVASRARMAAVNGETLNAWLDFDRIHSSCARSIEAPLVDLCMKGRINPAQLTVGLDFMLYDGLARLAFKEKPPVLMASRKSLEATRAEYAALDAEVMELRRAHIAATLANKKPPQGRQSAVRSELTEMPLIRAELAKQRRHIPIRQLIGRAGRSIQVLKPCFMMGPLSVAQYIAPGKLKFDLVIMDEASQMRPEDAIGALARGGQAVIVGDSKQLPPTSFFDRIAEGGDIDEEDGDGTLAEDSKSILELGEAIFDQRLLKWHYRSRHEALIAFSNRHFYKDELIVFPSPAGQSGRFGIGFTFVADGAALKGLNPVEAKVVASAAAQLLLNQPGRSLGVVAMNIKQSQRIADELANLAAENPVLAKALAEAENSNVGEPFFIKNLENVQGDERDVIMISMTYGPAQPGGHLPQNFGPINKETGWRRLNVLFTRAKERMEIISSMRSTDVQPKEGTDRGPRSLKLFLEYAETGRLNVMPRSSGRSPDSDFEEAIIEGLRELGFDCEPQLGVANFFLDIAVRDPGAPGEFVAAVECDGAAYHSCKSARDRDRLRQEILENLGWEVRRVWSTDWFRNPQGELARLAQELRSLVAGREEQRTRVRMPLQEMGVGAAESRPDGRDRVAGEHRELDRQALVRSPAHGGMSTDQARAQLVDIRERKIKPAFSDADPSRGFLRKRMLDELLRKRPVSMEEFRRDIPLELREHTDAEQVKKYNEEVFEILAQVS